MLNTSYQGLLAASAMDTKQILIGVAVVLFVMLGSVGASMFAVNYMLEKQEEDEIAAAEAEEAEESGELVDERPPVYVPFEPFVVNFMQGQSLRYLQLTVEFMTRDELTVEEINQRSPEIRNSLILLLSNHNYEQLSTREGKENVRAEIYAEVNALLDSEEGIESVYLTGFVMQ